MPYIPHQHNQNSSESIVDSSNRYDFTRFSKSEEQVIFDTINIVKTNLPRKYYSIGLAIESYEIVYKARYVLNELIIINYSKSLYAHDKLSVGLAYSTKGAFYRKKAIEFLEPSIKLLSDECIELLSHQFPLWLLYNLLSELCEKEYMFDKALDYHCLSFKCKPQLYPYDYIRPGKILEKKDIDMCVNYYKLTLEQPICESYKKMIFDELDNAQEKQEKGYKYKPRPKKFNEDDIELEEKINIAAKKFLKFI